MYTVYIARATKTFGQTSDTDIIQISQVCSHFSFYGMIYMQSVRLSRYRHRLWDIVRGGWPVVSKVEQFTSGPLHVTISVETMYQARHQDLEHHKHCSQELITIPLNKTQDSHCNFTALTGCFNSWQGKGYLGPDLSQRGHHTDSENKPMNITQIMHSE